MPSFWRRAWCSLVGHTWLEESRAAPVIPLFFVCGRCGKWRRL